MASQTNKGLVQKEILEIVNKLGFWMMKKEGLEGCAGFIHTPDRKIYLEVLFPHSFPNEPVILNMPRDLRQHPALFEFISELIQQTKDRNMGVLEVLEAIKAKISAIPASEMKARLLDELDDELNLLSSIYNVRTVDGKKYHVRIYYQLETKLNFEVEINYKDYPKKPMIVYHHGLEKLIGLPAALEILRAWDTSNPPHIVQIVQEIERRFTSVQGISDLQRLLRINNLTIINDQNQIITQKISISVLKGDIIGIYCLNRNIPLTFFHAFHGEVNRLEGEFKIFGKDLTQIENHNVLLVDFSRPMEGMASFEDFKIERILENAALDSPNRKETKKRIDSLLKIIGLSNRRKLKLEELGDGEQRRIRLARSAIKNPEVILLFEPDKGLNATESTRMWDAMININDQFSTTTFIYSLSDAIARCHNILVLSREGRQLGFGTLNQLIGELPILKEVIVIQLNEPNPADVETLGSISGITFMIEERAGEKYRLFTKINPNQIIPQIFQQLGSNIYNISKEPPTLIDFVPYKRVQEQQLPS